MVTKGVFSLALVSLLLILTACDSPAQTQFAPLVATQLAGPTGTPTPTPKGTKTPTPVPTPLFHPALLVEFFHCHYSTDGTHLHGTVSNISGHTLKTVTAQVKLYGPDYILLYEGGKEWFKDGEGTELLGHMLDRQSKNFHITVPNPDSAFRLCRLLFYENSVLISAQYPSAIPEFFPIEPG